MPVAGRISRIEDGTVTTAKLVDAAVTNPKILDQTIADDKLANPARKNLIINGDMRIAQRGTSADGTSAYLLDRFKKQVGGTPANGTISQDTDTPDGFQNSQKATFSGAATFYQTGQQIEFVNFSHLQGASVTASVYYKSDVDITLRIRHNTTSTDGTCLFGGTGSSVLSDTTLSASASWTRATHTFTINASSVAISLEFGTGALVSGDDIWITGVQLEAGSTASDFEHLNIAEQIQLCKRYFQISSFGSDWNGNDFFGGSVQHSMRATPSTSNVTYDLSSNINTANGVNGLNTGVGTSTKDYTQWQFARSAGSRAYAWGYFHLSSEL